MNRRPQHPNVIYRDEVEFSDPPGRDERVWRHPAEVAAEQRAAFSKSTVPASIVLGIVGGVGVVVAALTFVVAVAPSAPYGPVSSLPTMSVPARRPCNVADSAPGCVNVTTPTPDATPDTTTSVAATSSAPSTTKPPRQATQVVQAAPPTS